jgi:NADH-quinone oxidoreductase subunit E
MEITQVDRIIDEYKAEETALIQILLEIQKENHWLPRGVLLRVSERLQIPFNRVMNIASFHKTFSLIPEGRREIHVCNGSSCHAKGSQKVIDAVHETIGIDSGETDRDLNYSLKTTTCLGCCAAGPMMVVDGESHENVESAKVADILKNGN